MGRDMNRKVLYAINIFNNEEKLIRRKLIKIRRMMKVLVREFYKDPKDIPIEALFIDEHRKKDLIEHGFITLNDLNSLGWRKIENIPGIGNKTLENIKEQCMQYGFYIDLSEENNVAD